jgi:hypothetical protein
MGYKLLGLCLERGDVLPVYLGEITYQSIDNTSL